MIEALYSPGHIYQPGTNHFRDAEIRWSLAMEDLKQHVKIEEILVIEHQSDRFQQCVIHLILIGRDIFKSNGEINGEINLDNNYTSANHRYWALALNELNNHIKVEERETYDHQSDEFQTCVRKMILSCYAIRKVRHEASTIVRSFFG
ncbi:uncharacterized protein MELLADRAFT_114237 [Melampsora larici-populina 98AG31]|uniref:Uncharacterized protein n=1 Tax=Melampsora larici-populina (strain 98AG31 / pathotype 3-4-7) TaxID=747676 RepID=F4SCR2_MELLP|nr:uncharacterized protein MELLADRAFT_114237 [Melampsora larici-populina 98AG31]EGF97564.1 hypothetical protein MELLADRAFT_114237 [Melampsora larici-populina 98AG31]